MFIPASRPSVDPWLSCALPGIKDLVRPMFIPASHLPVDSWLSFSLYCSIIHYVVTYTI
ncbi:hypothetical protein RHMOL_Rhmol05G0165400 [Rhododendron molle]|nr:hypothetical protein RHMOL_Rhmol05G0165400 [Rhododendron molle]